MKISILDIGTQSIKHYIFDVTGTAKSRIHYKRYSEANLGENLEIQTEAIERNMQIISECIKTNKENGVEKISLLGTEILRRATNASDFTSRIKQEFNLDITILTHEEEALLLYKGFIPLFKKEEVFAAANIGGGSTEFVFGNTEQLITAQKIPFGAKYLRTTFGKDSGVEWKELENYLHTEITLDSSCNTLFITGVLDFILAVAPALGCRLDQSTIPNHPIEISIEKYTLFVEKLRDTPVPQLRELYIKDPDFCNNVAIGQSVYLAIAQKIGATTIIPSNNDLTDGVIFQLIS